MILTGATALFMAQIKPNPFLFIIGIVTIYLVGTADRYIKRVQSKPQLIDWAFSLGMLIFGSLFIIWGIISIKKGNSIGTVMLVFGSIGLFNVYKDFKNYNGQATHRNYHLLTHIGRMVGGFTATVTAVLVVNAQHIPLSISAVIYWLAPTLIFTPLSIYWIKNRKQLMLEMRNLCENCHTSFTHESDNAYICSYECTFCENCVENKLNHTCPNCGSEFQKRPKRINN